MRWIFLGSGEHHTPPLDTTGNSGSREMIIPMLCIGQNPAYERADCRRSQVAASFGVLLTNRVSTLRKKRPRCPMSSACRHGSEVSKIPTGSLHDSTWEMPSLRRNPNVGHMIMSRIDFLVNIILRLKKYTQRMMSSL